MAGTQIQTIVNRVRTTYLKESVQSYWQDSELLDHAKTGANDLWGAILDIHQKHFQTIDTTNVMLNPNTDHLDGVPNDCFRVILLEPRDTTSAGASQDILFYPRNYESDEFRNARQLTPQDPTVGLALFYELMNEGAPLYAPVVMIGPQVSSQVLVRFVYLRGPNTLQMQLNSINPIPGEADNALAAWIGAYARAKEREDRTPDPNLLMIYATEKQNLLVRMAPRQEQEPEVVEDLFAGYL